MAITISSEDEIEINHHFKVFAGPGAGKTHWLSLHVAHVLRESRCLGKMGKIACLSYTNVGADTLMGRMSGEGNRILSCTIHRFFYNHIVKPYLHFIALEEGFSIELLTGEDDRILFDDNTFNEIKESINKDLNKNDTYDVIKSLKWILQEDGVIRCCTKPQSFTRNQDCILDENAFVCYKKLAWAKGYMHYDDVLYFSYKLIQKYPFIAQTLAKQFPYVFVDEFQDTNPIQAKIIKQLGENGSIVGVIGDYAQSIYGFLGADPRQFVSFNLEGLRDYTISDNRRSCNEIIDLLNIIRTEFQQNPIRDEKTMRPLLLIGNLLDCYNKAKSIAKSEVYALSYRNIEANILKQGINVQIQNKNLFDTIVDSNFQRKEFIKTWIKAIEHARYQKFEITFKMLENIGITDIDAYISVKDALHDYENYNSGTLKDFFDYLRRNREITEIESNSETYDFYTSHTYREFSQFVGFLEDTSVQRTVHKAKGDEFDSVFVVFTQAKALGFLLNPNLQGEESHRVYYVAMSRARNRLFLTVPSLTPKMENKLKELPIDIQRF